MKSTHSMILALACLVLAAGCGPKGDKTGGVGKPSKTVEPAQVKAGEEETLFPLKVGYQWTYKVQMVRRVGDQQQTGSGETTFRVVKADPIPGGGTNAVLEQVDDKSNKVVSRQRWIVNSKGIYQVENGMPMVAYTPMQPAVAFPVTPEAKFEWTGKGTTPAGKSGTNKVNNIVRAPQEIDTDTGPMSAIPVDSQTEFTYVDQGKTLKGRSTSTAYWVPNIGIARYRQEVAVGNAVAIQSLVLKNYVLK